MLPSLPLMFACTAAVSASTAAAAADAAPLSATVSHDFWWWLALGLSGFFVVVLLFLLLASWHYATSAAAVAARARRHSRSQKRLVKHPSGGGLSDGLAGASPALTAPRRASEDVEGGQREAAVDELAQYVNRTPGQHTGEMAARLATAGAPPTPPVSRPASTSTTVAAAITGARSGERTSSHDHTTVDPPPLAKLGAGGDASLVTPLENPLAPSGLHASSRAAEPVPATAGSAPASTPSPRDATGADSTAATRNTAARTPNVEVIETLAGAEAPAFAAVPPSAGTGSRLPSMHQLSNAQCVPPLRAQANPLHCTSPPGVTQYFFGFRTPSTMAATQLPPTLLLPSASGTTASATGGTAESPFASPKTRSTPHRGWQSQRRAAAPPARPSTPLRRRAATAAPPPCALHTSGVFEPLTLSSALTPRAAAAAAGSSELVSLAELESLPRQASLESPEAGAWAGVGAGTATTTSSRPLMSARASLKTADLLVPSQPKRWLELFTAPGERGAAASTRPSSADASTASAAAAVAGAALGAGRGVGGRRESRSVPRVHATEEEHPRRQVLLLPRVDAIASSNQHHHRSSSSRRRARGASLSRHSLQSGSSSGASPSRVPSGQRPSSETVTKGVPQLFFGTRDSASARGSAAAHDFAAPRKPTATSATSPRRSSRGSAAAAAADAAAVAVTTGRRHPPPPARPLSVEQLAQAPASALLSSPSFLSSLSPRSRAAAVAGAAPAHVNAVASAGSTLAAACPSGASHRGSFSSSMNGRSPFRSGTARMRTSSQVTFIDKDGVRVGSGPRDAEAVPNPQQQQLSHAREGSPGSTALAAMGSAARRERLPDPTPHTSTTAAAPSSANDPVAPGYRSHVPSSASESSLPHRRQRSDSPAAREPSVAATATPPHSAPLDVVPPVAAHLLTSAAAAATAAGKAARPFNAHGSSFSLSSSGAATAARGGSEGRVGGTLSRAALQSPARGAPSAAGDDAESEASEASTMAAGMLPDAPADSRHGQPARGMEPPLPPLPSHASFSRPHPSGIEVLRITRSTGAVEEAVPVQLTQRRSRS